MGMVRLLIFLICVYLVILTGCVTSMYTQPKEEMNCWEEGLCDGILAEQAIDFCLWSVVDSYGPLDVATARRVLSVCEEDYLRYKNSQE